MKGVNFRYGLSSDGRAVVTIRALQIAEIGRRFGDSALESSFSNDTPVPYQNV